MKKILWFWGIAVFTFLASNAVAGEMIVSTFDSDLESWTYGNDPTSATVTWQSAGGYPSGGYMKTEEGTYGDTYFVRAPLKFLGDLTEFIGGTISYDAKVITSQSFVPPTGTNWGRVNIRRTGYGWLKQIPGREPGNAWTHFSFPLNAAIWTDNFGGPITEQKFYDVLSDVEEIFIELEVSVNPEIVGVDNFRIETARTPITIDIKPGDATNSISLKSKTVPVAILASSTFDALNEVDIARSTLTFGPTGYEQSLDSCTLRKPKDVNGDGRKDLVCQFLIKDAALKCGVVEVFLKGETIDGTLFKGSQDVLITPCK